uniref:ATP synthase F0 subunit 8 n=1 Tax=Phyllidiopsis shireenae TaxID=1881998 RepID=UPI002A82BCDD|nr:ATP synthase F0 subunit 8 [Phyllidiopsis shireenae]WNR50792.1 ATP synthase F0 subunit 8 [Phyllidiopsis shireenae]
MPQLSPMLGFFMFLFILTSYIILLCGLSKKHLFVTPTKISKSTKISILYF